MIYKKKLITGLLAGLLFIVIGCSDRPNTTTKSSANYEDLVTFFNDWRKFQTPAIVNGIPDYRVAAMQKQRSEITQWQDRLNAFDTTRWPIKHQIDWYLIWAEMNGLYFDHQVTRPWVRDPAFYVWFFPEASDVPAREGPNIFGRVELSEYPQPLSPRDAMEISNQLRKAEAVFQQARINLTGNARDLWITGIRSIREQSEELEKFAGSVDAYPDLVAAARSARDASNRFAEWLDQQASTKTEPSGVGKDNFTWYLKNVHLVPYTWNEEKVLLERELYRAHSALRLAEHRNRKLPKLVNTDSEEDYLKLQETAVRDYMKFLEQEEFLTVKPYMEPAMRQHIIPFTPKGINGDRGFFLEVDHRSPMPMRAHHYHWIDKARERLEPNESVIRQHPSLSNMFDTRAEGMATAMEELVMNAGLLADNPRATELVYIMLAQRAARGLGGLYQHGLEMNFDEATKYASQWVPWGLLPADGGTIQHEEQFYLRQPAYEASYVIGKLQIDQLIAEFARQRKDNFILKEFMDEFNQVGIIPMSLVYWQMTGDKSMVLIATGK